MTAKKPSENAKTNCGESRSGRRAAGATREEEAVHENAAPKMRKRTAAVSVLLPPGPPEGQGRRTMGKLQKRPETPGGDERERREGTNENAGRNQGG